MQMPAYSTCDRDNIGTWMRERTIFPRVVGAKARGDLEARILKCKRITTLSSFSEDTILLELCYTVLSDLLPARWARKNCSLREMLQHVFTLEIEKFPANYLQIWLHVMRDFPALSNSRAGNVRKDKSRSKPMTRAVDPEKMAQLGHRASQLGFQTEKISKLADLCSASVDQAVEISRPAYTGDDHSLDPRHRCGRPRETDFSRGRGHLFLEHILATPCSPSGAYVTWSAAARETIHAFWKDCLLVCGKPRQEDAFLCNNPVHADEVTAHVEQMTTSLITTEINRTGRVSEDVRHSRTCSVGDGGTCHGLGGKSTGETQAPHDATQAEHGQIPPASSVYDSWPPSRTNSNDRLADNAQHHDDESRSPPTKSVSTDQLMAWRDTWLAGVYNPYTTCSHISESTAHNPVSASVDVERQTYGIERFQRAWMESVRIRELKRLRRCPCLYIAIKLKDFNVDLRGSVYGNVLAYADCQQADLEHDVQSLEKLLCTPPLSLPLYHLRPEKGVSTGPIQARPIVLRDILRIFMNSPIIAIDLKSDRAHTLSP
ncbi:hypothetical protein LTR62_002341 [Meristemomyces frigidus]|uniref:Uncharacterized protein n=1 Tax=Meristemomyces frigidus TaxID=1508187 RepID=A0AAN7YB43_9PEZI|nr:hypothetical protein LTR62_002341 [Meristemomyces frigidus]